MVGIGQSRQADGAAPETSFIDVALHTGAVWAMGAAVPAGLIVLLVGAKDELDAGAIAAGMVVSAIAFGVSWFHLRAGAGGFPRRLPVRPGDQVGGWLVIDRLTDDATYVVRRSGQHGVLKVVHHPNDEAARDRASREAHLLRSVNARHVVAVLASGTTPTSSYLVTRYLGSQTTWGRRHLGPIPDGELYSIAAGTMRGLVALHRAGITHRDLTPFNIMVDDSGGATIIDLGIARADATTQATSTQSRIVTVGYRAPEQFDGRTTHAADVFVWAATVYYLATGDVAFPGNEAEIQNQIRSSMPDLGRCPTWLRPALHAAFTRDPDLRPAAADALALLEEQGQRQGWAISAPTQPRPPQTFRPPGAIGPSVLLAIAALGCLALYLLAQRPTDDQAGDGPRPPESTAVDPPGDGEPGTTSATTPTTDDETTTTPSSTTATTTPPRGPAAEFIGVWFGGSVGADGEVPVVFAIDNPAAINEGDALGDWSFPTCTGPLRLVSATDTELIVTPVEAVPECGFGGRATLTRSGESAAYNWQSDEGTETRTGTFTRSARVTLDDPGWPTDRNDASPAFFAGLGACLAGGSGCSESGQLPTWTACTTDDLCISGGDADVVDVWEGLTWRAEIPESTPNAAVALLAVGFTEDQVVDLVT